MSIPHEICDKIRARLEKSGVDCQDPKSRDNFFEKALDRPRSEISKTELAFLKNMLSLAASNDVAEPSIAHKYFPNSDTYTTTPNIEKSRVVSDTMSIPNDSRVGDFTITTPPEIDSYFLIEASINMTEARILENIWREKPLMDKGRLDENLFSSPDMILHSAVNFCIQNEIPFSSEGTVLTWDTSNGHYAARGFAAQMYGRFNEEGKLKVATFETGFNRDPKGPGRLDIEQMRLSSLIEKRKLRKAVKADIAAFDPSNKMDKEGRFMESYRNAIFDKLIGNKLDSLCREVSLGVAPVQGDENKEAYLKNLEEKKEFESPSNKFKGDDLSL